MPEPGRSGRPRRPFDYSCFGDLELTDERILEVRRHYFANVTLIIDAAIGRIATRCGAGAWTATRGSCTQPIMARFGTDGLLNKMLF